ncbi:MAG: class I SAM-dependent methyltransferase [Burkholderiaceae bacterium]
MTNAYPIDTTLDEIARLRIQSDLYRSDAHQMLSMIGVQPGWRCLDMCSGIGGITDVLNHHVGATGEVIGFELDHEKVAVAQQWVTINGYRQVSFLCGDGFDSGLVPASFDLVHLRFALGIIPGGVKMLDHALSLVKPGGVIFLEEADAGSLACYPEHPAWGRAVSLILECFEKIGSDIVLGRKLNSLLNAADVSVTHLRPCRYLLRAGEPMINHIPLTLDTLQNAIIKLGLADADTIRTTVTELLAHLRDPDVVVSSVTMVQAVGRVP